nr:hypothetical protein Iba_chr12fCG17510 [Ipomoea batatas]
MVEGTVVGGAVRGCGDWGSYSVWRGAVVQVCVSVVRLEEAGGVRLEGCVTSLERVAMVTGYAWNSMATFDAYDLGWEKACLEEGSRTHCLSLKKRGCDSTSFHVQKWASLPWYFPMLESSTRAERECFSRAMERRDLISWNSLLYIAIAYIRLLGREKSTIV